MEDTTHCLEIGHDKGRTCFYLLKAQHTVRKLVDNYFKRIISNNGVKNKIRRILCHLLIDALQQQVVKII